MCIWARAEHSPKQEECTAFLESPALCLGQFRAQALVSLTSVKFPVSRFLWALCVLLTR